MTTKQKLQEKLDELEELKAELLRVEPFLNPDNDSFVYSTESLSDIAGTQGSTPSNLSEILEVVVVEINKYVDYIKKLPFAETSVIYRDRSENELAFVSTGRKDFHPPVRWTEKAVDVSVDAVLGYLAMSEYYGSIKSMRIYCSPTIRKNDISGRDISLEVKLVRTNGRLNTRSDFRSGTGPLDVTISDEVIAPDDIYMIGIMTKENVTNDIIYYADLTYSIEFTYHDGSTSKEIYSMANKKIGNNILDIDTTLTYGCVYWDMLLIGNMGLFVKNSMGNTTNPPTSIDGPISGGLFDSNIVTDVGIGMFSTDIESYKFSYRSGCSWVRLLTEGRFSLYDKNESNVAGVIFNNLRPLDLILEEAIDAL